MKVSFGYGGVGVVTEFALAVVIEEVKLLGVDLTKSERGFEAVEMKEVAAHWKSAKPEKFGEFVGWFA